MCFVLDIKSFPRIAFKDIKVQKLLIKTNNNYITPYQIFEYRKGVIYKSKFKFEFDSIIHKIYINEGLHSYTKKIEITINNINNTRFCDIIFDGIKYKMDIFNKDNNLYVKECIIPKGSIYFVNKDNEIVSNKLKLI